jgi:hypothetical protein
MCVWYINVSGVKDEAVNWRRIETNHLSYMNNIKDYLRYAIGSTMRRSTSAAPTTTTKYTHTHWCSSIKIKFKTSVGWRTGSGNFHFPLQDSFRSHKIWKMFFLEIKNLWDQTTDRSEITTCVSVMGRNIMNYLKRKLLKLLSSPTSKRLFDNVFLLAPCQWWC